MSDIVASADGSQQQDSVNIMDDFDDVGREDGDYSNYREQRILELKRQYQQREAMEHKNHGLYREIEEKDFLKEVTESAKCVVHFFHPEFRRCEIMDKHLKTISSKYFQTKFVKINVLLATFFVTKLQVQVLPAVILFDKGVAVDRVVGFDEFGGSDDFSTLSLERRLGTSGVIPFKEKEAPSSKRNIRQGGRAAGGDDGWESDQSYDDDDF
eukprot:TRINITY_DN4914_c0_g1_i1.p1 TRINITY_DN4914_c0_g1~~TRINITY_DN4914_c0_g1_i1.p1  ORF type:complete len:212 (-),score=57.74 TRINITY_DN4914_c0_g1_i1:508-1143(-)